MTILLSAALLSFMYCFRGGMGSRLLGLNLGDQLPRALYGVSIGAVAVAVAPASQVNLLVIFAMVAVGGFIGMALIGHADYQNKSPALEQLFGMSMVGVARSLFIGLALPVWKEPEVFLPLFIATIVGGALAGPAYWLGWRSPSPLPSWREPRSTEMGELYYGLLLGASMGTSQYF